MLVNGAALDRQLVSPQRDERGLEPGCPVNDDELGPFQGARIEIVEELAPRGGAFPAHIPDGKQCLLDAAPHTDGGQNRDVLRLFVETRLDDGTVEDQPDDVLTGQAADAPGVSVGLHLAPCPADHILADSPFEQRKQRALHPPRVRAREVNRSDQRFGRLGQPLVARQRL